MNPLLDVFKQYVFLLIHFSKMVLRLTLKNNTWNMYWQ